MLFKLFRPRAARKPLSPLARGVLFSPLSRRELRTVENFLHRRHFLAGEVVFDQGDDGQAIYLVVSGRVSICYQGLGNTPIATLGPGEFFGELALLDDAARSAQARASEDCELAVLFRGDFERLMAAHGQIASKIAMQLARHLAHRLRGMLLQAAGQQS